MYTVSRPSAAVWGALVAVSAAGVGFAMAAGAKVPLPRPKPAVLGIGQPERNRNHSPAPRAQAARMGSEAYAQAGAGLRGALFASRAAIKPLARPVSGPFAIAPTTATSNSDIGLVRQVIDAVHKGNEAIADVAERAIADPVARKLAEWIVLRSNNTNPTFRRYANFVKNNPDWPHSAFFRRRAENALWNDKIDGGTVRDFFAHRPPTMAKGRYMLAHELLAQGDRAGATALVRHAWRYQDASSDVERMVLEQFGGLLTREDHRVRMDKRFYEDESEAGLRAAQRLGGNELAIAKAWSAVLKKAGNAKALLDAVPASAHGDAGYIFARAVWMRKHDKPEEAARLILSAPRDAAALVDVNQWWQERRILVRQLLDKHDAQTAYRVARDAVSGLRVVLVEQLTDQDAAFLPPLIDIDQRRRVARRRQDQARGFFRLVVFAHPNGARENISGVAVSGCRHRVKQRLGVAGFFEHRAPRFGDGQFVAAETLSGA